ncbi:HAD family hydrolase [Streptomyces sp. NPDC059994]|uniref:HAD family hydrolase n=1 Tax=Streptomyces sp. NPDC059994 TaxID=3347029 RepID=UPI0036A71C61
MPSASLNLPVTGTVSRGADGPLLVLSQRLDGHDTFLKGSLDVGGTSVDVRILTLDDVTVLRPADHSAIPGPDTRWQGTLHLPHGLRPRTIPSDLLETTECEERTLEPLDEAELRYVLTFLSESATAAIRQARVEAIVSALPATTSSATEPPLLVTVDVGGTLGSADGPGLSMRLAEASPLPAARARAIMRASLHTQPSLTEAVVAEVCEALEMPPEAFPRDIAPAPFRLFPGATEALRRISAVARVVTLSNVTCVDADTEGLRGLLSPWVSDYFPSCRIGHTKPDPRAFHAVLDHLGAARNRVIHVGDDWACDIVGAVESGIRAIWISRGRQVPDAAMVVDHGVLVATDLAAAATHIEHLAAGSVA